MQSNLPMRNDLIEASKVALECLVEMNDPQGITKCPCDFREEILILKDSIEKAERNMENTTPTNYKELTIAFLNGLAKYFEDKLMSAEEFTNHCNSAISIQVFIGNMDKIEERLLRDQVLDIKNGEYTRFCDPEELMPPQKETCGYDLDPKNDIALDQ